MNSLAQTMQWQVFNIIKITTYTYILPEKARKGKKISERADLSSERSSFIALNYIIKVKALLSHNKIF